MLSELAHEPTPDTLHAPQRLPSAPGAVPMLAVAQGALGRAAVQRKLLQRAARRSADRNQAPMPGAASIAPTLDGLAPPASGGETGAALAQNLAADTNSPPVEQYVIPFDHNPKAAPGEQIIFGATYSHATPGNYKLVYTSQGGHFDQQGSGVTTKNFPGLSQRNINWFINSAWNGTTTTSMRLQVQENNGSVVATTNWSFSKKGYQPTTITQQETEGERDNPAVYTYKLGPSRNSGGDDYTGFTVLEKFDGPYTTNLRLADIKPAYAQAHSLSSDQDVAAHFFPGTGDNGTFTASAGDRIADQHGGMAGADQAKAQLVSPKQIEKILSQTYEPDPGTALGRYQIKRLMKLDGVKKITKKRI